MMRERCCLPAVAAGLSVLLATDFRPAAAQDESGVRPGWSLRLGGFYNALVIVRDQTNPPGEEIRNYDFNQRGRFSIQAQNRLDNGLTVGFQNQYEMQQNTANNRSYLFLRSGIGLFQFGTMYTAAYQLHEEPLAAGWYTDDSGHYQGFASTNGLKTNVQTMPGFISDRDMTATWISPRVARVQVGFSYTPDNTSGGQQAVNMNNRFVRDENDYNNVKELFAATINYEHNHLPELRQDLSIGMQTGKVVTGAPNARSRRTQIGVGTNLYYGGFALGGGFRVDNSNIHNGDTQDMIVTANYRTGPWYVGPTLALIRETGGDTLKRRNLIADFGITYTLAPGVNLVTSLQYANFDKGRGNEPAFKDGHAYALEYGIQVRF